MTNLQQIEARISELRLELEELEAQAEEYYAAEQEAQMEQEISRVDSLNSREVLNSRFEYWHQVCNSACSWREDANAYYMALVYEYRLTELGYINYRSLDRIYLSMRRQDEIYFGPQEDSELLVCQEYDEWLDYEDQILF